MNNLRCLFLLVCFSVLFACGTKSKYTASNKVYVKKTKALTDVIKKIPQVTTTPAAKRLSQQDVHIPNEWVSTVNLNLRKPNLVVLHYTAQNSIEQTLETFTASEREVSAHYVIGKNGKIIQMLNDYLRAWHAGVGKWGGQTDLNSNSIGIEIDNNGKEAFSSEQIQSLLILLDTLKHRYNIPQANFIGHSDLAPSRKIDPGKFFPWKLLAEKGFGYWYEETDIANFVPPTNFDPKTALRIIGYETKNYDAAVKAFKLHFFPEDESTSPLFDARQCALLYQLYLKYL